MPVHVFTSIADIEAAVGRTLGATDWIEIDQARVDRFADVTGDHQWIHVDVNRARSSAFGGTIVHGYLTLAMLPSLAAQRYRFEAGTARLNYGVEKVRFPAALPVGARIRGTPTIARVRQIATGTQVSVSWIVEADGISRPVCIANGLTLVLN